MDAEFVRWLTTLGVGGALAAFMFTFYRKDVKAYTELWKSQSEILIKVVQENTASTAKLITLVDAFHRRLDDHRLVRLEVTGPIGDITDLHIGKRHDE